MPVRRKKTRRRRRWPWLIPVVLVAAAWAAWQGGFLPESEPVPPAAAPRPAGAAPAPPPAPHALPPAPRNVAPTPPVPLIASSAFTARPVRDAFEAQLALDRLGISPGSLDGVAGSQTRAAVRAFQQREGLPITGELDATTRARLVLDGAPFAEYTITADDLARLLPVSDTWLGKSLQDRLDYESVLELVAEKAHAHPLFIRRLNPSVDWVRITPGTRVHIPNAAGRRVTGQAAQVRIRLAARTLQAFDADGRLLAQFPCSIGRFVEQRPLGELRVAVLAPNPNYVFSPENFPESAEARELGRRLVLPPGPNNPVGTAWIGLDRPGYGIHGTPSPEQVGRTESHGCFRLANWNAEHLLELAWIGMPVVVEE
jgi:lipoprotein-anchoring transpeptidase ErfK/SrfK